MGHVVNLFQPESKEANETKPLEHLTEVHAVAVQFLSKGRNAWHSTWIRRYHVGDFVREGHALRDVIRQRRTRGTVFYLSVLPAIQFHFGKRIFILAEINTHEPFRNLDTLQAGFTLVNLGLSEFLKMVQPPSPLWKKGQCVTDRVILQEVSSSYIDLAAYAAVSNSLGSRVNPPLGNYERSIHGSSYGVSEWSWEPRSAMVKTKLTSRWFTSAVAAIVDGCERRRHHEKQRQDSR